MKLLVVLAVTVFAASLVVHAAKEKHKNKPSKSPKTTTEKPNATTFKTPKPKATSTTTAKPSKTTAKKAKDKKAKAPVTKSDKKTKKGQKKAPKDRSEPIPLLDDVDEVSYEVVDKNEQHEEDRQSWPSENEIKAMDKFEGLWRSLTDFLAKKVKRLIKRKSQKGIRQHRAASTTPPKSTTSEFPRCRNDDHDEKKETTKRHSTVPRFFYARSNNSERASQPIHDENKKVVDFCEVMGEEDEPRPKTLEVKGLDGKKKILVPCPMVIPASQSPDKKPHVRYSIPFPASSGTNSENVGDHHGKKPSNQGQTIRIPRSSIDGNEEGNMIEIELETLVGDYNSTDGSEETGHTESEAGSHKVVVIESEISGEKATDVTTKTTESTPTTGEKKVARDSQDAQVTSAEVSATTPMSPQEQVHIIELPVPSGDGEEAAPIVIIETSNGNSGDEEGVAGPVIRAAGDSEESNAETHKNDTTTIDLEIVRDAGEPTVDIEFYKSPEDDSQASSNPKKHPPPNEDKVAHNKAGKIVHMRKVRHEKHKIPKTTAAPASNTRKTFKASGKPIKPKKKNDLLKKAKQSRTIQFMARANGPMGVMAPGVVYRIPAHQHDLLTNNQNGKVLMLQPDPFGQEKAPSKSQQFSLPLVSFKEDGGNKGNVAAETAKVKKSVPPSVGATGPEVPVDENRSMLQPVVEADWQAYDPYAMAQPMVDNMGQAVEPVANPEALIYNNVPQEGISDNFAGDNGLDYSMGWQNPEPADYYNTGNYIRAPRGIGPGVMMPPQQQVPTEIEIDLDIADGNRAVNEVALPGTDTNSNGPENTEMMCRVVDTFYKYECEPKYAADP